jgi:hypothetical protein
LGELSRRSIPRTGAGSRVKMQSCCLDRVQRKVVLGGRDGENEGHPDI